jgi:hypothetical protein
MWLIMRGALDDKVAEIYRFYIVPASNIRRSGTLFLRTSRRATVSGLPRERLAVDADQGETRSRDPKASTTRRCTMKICVANGLVLLDYKTSNGVYSDMLIQLAAYKNLWEENRPDLPITGGCHLLRFAKERGDFAHHYFQELDDEWEQFLLFRQAYDLDKALKKRAA